MPPGLGLVIAMPERLIAARLIRIHINAFGRALARPFGSTHAPGKRQCWRYNRHVFIDRGVIRLRVIGLFGSLALCCSAFGQVRDAPRPTFTKDQEARLLTATRMIAASERCEGVRLDDGTLTAFLRRAGISDTDVHVKVRSKALIADIKSYVGSFRGHKADVCSAALAEGRQNGLLKPD